MYVAKNSHANAKNTDNLSPYLRTCLHQLQKIYFEAKKLKVYKSRTLTEPSNAYAYASQAHTRLQSSDWINFRASPDHAYAYASQAEP